MSLYNSIFGLNPFAGTLLRMLGVEHNEIPRFRDCFMSKEGQIVVYTRTGGGNRPFFEKAECQDGNATGPWNDDIRAVPGFIEDRDGEFDSTFAFWYFKVPEDHVDSAASLMLMGAVADPEARWKSMLDGMNSGDTANPDVAKAMQVGEQMFKKMGL